MSTSEADGMDRQAAIWQPHSYELGESLIWDDRTQSFWWVDIHAGRLFHSGLSDEQPEQWQFDEALGHVALTDTANRLVLGLAGRLLLFDVASGARATLVEVPHAVAGMRVNDGRCDRHGSLVFGTMSEGGKGHPGAFWRFNSRQGLSRLNLPAPAIPNSICFSPDGLSLYFTDSARKVIHVCNYDPSSGAVSNVRDFVDPGVVEWEPDGSCVDAAGGVWNARWGGGCIARYLPSGALDRIIDSPAHQTTCPCLGGENLDVLFATSARIGISHDRQCEADGVVLCWSEPGLKGLPEGRVAGL